MRYAVFGRPIAHSKSPLIHQLFGQSVGLTVDYRAIEVVEDLATSLVAFRAAGGMGANITVPFKEVVFNLAHASLAVHPHNISPRAQVAMAANTVWWSDKTDKTLATLCVDNTDGIGLVRDLIRILGGEKKALESKSILLIGSGGAAKGVIGELLAQSPQRLIIANRTTSKADAVVKYWKTNHPHAVGHTHLQAIAFETLTSNHSTAFDLIINATSAFVNAQTNEQTNAFPTLSATLIHANTLIYDMMYGKKTPLLAWAQQLSLTHSDGLGMLVEQAAESFYLWHGIRPQTRDILAHLSSIIHV